MYLVGNAEAFRREVDSISERQPTLQRVLIDLEKDADSLDSVVHDS